MFRQARILPCSCGEQLWADLEKKAEETEAGLLAFLIDDRHPEKSQGVLDESAPLHFSWSSSQALKGSFLDFARELLVFPDEEANPSRQVVPPPLDVLAFVCGQSPICSLRTGRMLAEFAAFRSIPSELIVLQREGQSEGLGAAGQVMANILRSRNNSQDMEKLAIAHPSYFFLAAGYVSGGFQRPGPNSDLEKLGNIALQNSEN